MAKIIVHNTGVTVISVNNEDFISLTDIARYKSARIQQASAKLRNVFVKALLWC